MQGDLKATVEAKKNEMTPEFQPKWWGETLGLYVHVPFCATACDFCAFYQVQSDRDGIRSYLDGIGREMSFLGVNQPIDTCYWGGGTPGLLTARDLQILFESVVGHLGQPLREWTVEMAPSTVKADKLKILKEQGVTRISMGVQSFDDGLLDKLGRQHSRKQVMKAYDLIRKEGFDSVNLDLIFAIPGQDESRLRRDIQEAAILEPDHLSTYCLTFEEDTALFVQLSKGSVSIDVDLEARLYTACWDEMAKRGFEQYEVSNFAQPGKRCRHNLNTWKMDQWIGVGPSASSQYCGQRYTNVPDLRLWLEGVENGTPDRVDCSELSIPLLIEDSLIFGLRMNDGVDLDRIGQRFGQTLSVAQQNTLRQLEREEKLVRKNQKVWLTDEGRLVADAIGSALMV